MSDWAIVIGIDKYQSKNSCLKGAVKDALKMRDWLLSASGGRIPSENLSLLLAPDQHAPPVDVAFTQATRNNVILAIADLLRDSEGRDGRLFFYFSGHGITSRMAFMNQSALVFSDFTEDLPDNSLTCASLFEVFKSTAFSEQFFFVDACRNMPFAAEIRLGEYPRPAKPRVPQSPQFVMYATMPGVKAEEILHPGSERGAFTGELLDGLKGIGSAKRWDERSGEYVTRWNSLVDHVETRVQTLKELSEKGIVQVPSQYGERQSQNPELARFDSAKVSKEKLTSELTPNGIGTVASVMVDVMGGLAHLKLAPLTLPEEVKLTPRTYSVRASAPGYSSKPLCMPVELYHPQWIKIELVPAKPNEGHIADIQACLPDLKAATTKHASAIATSSDPLAMIEVTDASGKLLLSHRGRVHLNAEPGYYSGRLISPEGRVTETLIELPPGARPA